MKIPASPGPLCAGAAWARKAQGAALTPSFSFSKRRDSQIICRRSFDRGQGKAADSSQPDFDSAFGGEVADQFDDAIERRCSIVRNVERDLHAIVAARQGKGAQRAQAAVAFANCPSIVRTAGRSVVANSILKAMRTSRSDRDCSGAGVAGNVTFVRQPAVGDRLAAPNRRQRQSFGRSRRRAVVERRYAVASPSRLPARCASAVASPRVAPAAERTATRRARRCRMYAASGSQVDALECDAASATDASTTDRRCPAIVSTLR